MSESIASIMQVGLQARIVLPNNFVDKEDSALVVSKPDSLLVGMGENLVSVDLSEMTGNFTDGGFAAADDAEQFLAPLFDLPTDVLGQTVAINIHAIYDDADNKELVSATQGFSNVPDDLTSDSITVVNNDESTDTDVLSGGAKVKLLVSYINDSALTSVRVFMFVNGQQSESDIYEHTNINTDNMDDNDTVVLRCPFRRLTDVDEGDEIKIVVVAINAIGESAAFKDSFTVTDKPGPASDLEIINIGRVEGVATARLSFTAENQLKMNGTLIRTTVNFIEDGNPVLAEEIDAVETYGDGYVLENNYQFDININSLVVGTDYLVEVVRTTVPDAGDEQSCGTHGSTYFTNDLAGFVAPDEDAEITMTIADDTNTGDRTHTLGATDFLTSLVNGLETDDVITRVEWVIDGGAPISIDFNDDLDNLTYSHVIADFVEKTENETFTAAIKVYVERGQQAETLLSELPSGSSIVKVSPYIPNADGVTMELSNTDDGSLLNTVGDIKSVKVVFSDDNGLAGRTFKVTINEVDETANNPYEVVREYTMGDAGDTYLEVITLLSGEGDDGKFSSNPHSATFVEINATADEEGTIYESDIQNMATSEEQEFGYFRVVGKPNFSVVSVSAEASEDPQNKGQVIIKSAWELSGSANANNVSMLNTTLSVKLVDSSSNTLGVVTLDVPDDNATTTHEFELTASLAATVVNVVAELQTNNATGIKILSDEITLEDESTSAVDAAALLPTLGSVAATLGNDGNVDVELTDVQNGFRGLHSLDIILVADADLDGDQTGNDDIGMRTITRVHSFKDTSLSDINILVNSLHNDKYNMTIADLSLGTAEETPMNVGALVLLRNEKGTVIGSADWNIDQIETGIE